MKIVFFLFFLLCSLFSYGCQAFDISTSSKIYEYSRPKIEKLAIENNNLTVTISANFNPVNRNDFFSYVIFATEKENNFDNLRSIDLNGNSITSFSSLPFFITNTSKPVFVKKNVEPLSQKIILNSSSYNFVINKDYKITVLAWGVNEEFARSFNNNGWIFSPYAEEKSFHYRQEKLNLILNQFSQKTNNNNYGFNLINGEIVLVNFNTPSNNPLTSTNQIIFYMDNSDNINMGMFFTSGGSLIQPLGSSYNFSQVINLPETGYLEPNGPIPISQQNVYVIKNMNGTYMKIYVNSLNVFSETNVVNLNVAYSIKPNERNF